MGRPCTGAGGGRAGGASAAAPGSPGATGPGCGAARRLLAGRPDRAGSQGREAPCVLAVGGVRYDDKPGRRTASRGPWPVAAGAARGRQGRLAWNTLQHQDGTGADQGAGRPLHALTLMGLRPAPSACCSNCPGCASLTWHPRFLRRREVPLRPPTRPMLFDRWVWVEDGARPGAWCRLAQPVGASAWCWRGQAERTRRTGHPVRTTGASGPAQSWNWRAVGLRDGPGRSGRRRGRLGLQRAFHIAAATTWGQPWKVDDEATRPRADGAVLPLPGRGEVAAHRGVAARQLALHHKPGQIKKWSAGGRGINLKEVYARHGQAPPRSRRPARRPRGCGGLHPLRPGALSVVSSVGKGRGRAARRKPPVGGASPHRRAYAAPLASLLHAPHEYLRDEQRSIVCAGLPPVNASSASSTLPAARRPMEQFSSTLSTGRARTSSRRVVGLRVRPCTDQLIARHQLEHRSRSAGPATIPGQPPSVQQRQRSVLAALQRGDCAADE